jgi:hypothetical protein
MQLQLPMIPAGATKISGALSVESVDDKWRYLIGMNMIFEHPKDDIDSFRMFTSSLILLGSCKNIDIEKAFGVSKSSVIRHKNKYEKYGPAAFFKKK